MYRPQLKLHDPDDMLGNDTPPRLYQPEGNFHAGDVVDPDGNVDTTQSLAAKGLRKTLHQGQRTVRTFLSRIFSFSN